MNISRGSSGGRYQLGGLERVHVCDGDFMDRAGGMGCVGFV